MANIKITDLTAYGNPTSTDVLPIVDVGADVTKKVSVADLLENAGSGTEALPGIAFDGDSNTGIYRPGADQLAISTNGTGRLFVNSSGQIFVGQSAALSNVSGQRLELTDDIVINTSATGTGTEAGLNFCHLISNSTATRAGARIASISTAAYTAGIGSTYDADLAIQTSQNGTLSERLRITSAGTLMHLGAGNSTTPAVQFNGSAPVDSLVIDSSGRLGIGTTSPAYSLHLANNGTLALQLEDTSTSTRYRIENTSGDLSFVQSGVGERMRIDGSGRLLVGTSSSTSSNSKLQVHGGSNPLAELLMAASNADGPALYLSKSRGSLGSPSEVSSGDTLGSLIFQGYDGATWQNAAYIQAFADGTWTDGGDTTDNPSRLVFSTTADGASSPTEAMRITKDQAVCIKRTGVVQAGNSLAVAGNGTNTVIGIQLVATSGSVNALEFTDGSGQNCGEIVCDTSANTTSYSTTSDYRLKENVVPIANATQRLNQLRPYRFNFISAPSTTFDGFLAHEAQEVVPEAVNRIKDQVDENGNPEYQTIDQSKLVPLLTAALQEALAEIESLKARVTALEP